jgi:hypothetical protein
LRAKILILCFRHLAVDKRQKLDVRVVTAIKDAYATAHSARGGAADDVPMLCQVDIHVTDEELHEIINLLQLLQLQLEPANRGNLSMEEAKKNPESIGGIHVHKLEV